MFSLQEKDASKPVGNWLSFYGPIYERIFTNIFSLLTSPTFLIMIVPTQVACF